MKEITLTCPFTGVEFKALEQNDGTLLVKNPISGNMHVLKCNEMGKIEISRNWLDHINMVNAKEAAEILEISRQRISAIIQNKTIPSYLIANTPMLKLSDVLKFKETRKCGRPFKEQ